MPISVTCQCGSRLEIDEKFLGKEIPCPDCNRPLPTNPAVMPPPLELPDNRRVSGWAVLSLTLALVGAFTIVGTLAAMVLGAYALRDIARRPTRLEGAGFARAGIYLGGALTVITLAALLSPTIFGIDVFLRELVWVDHLDRPTEDPIISSDQKIEMKRPSNAWARYKSKSQIEQPDPLIVVNVADDIYIDCLEAHEQNDFKAPEGQERKKLVLDAVYKSELVALLAHLPKGEPLGREGTVVEEKPGPGSMEEIILDLRLGRIDRRLLIRSTVSNQTQLNIAVVVARRSHFDRMKEEFRKIIDTVNFKNFK